MQIAPTIKQIDTRFDILCSPILINRSQDTLDRFGRFLPAMPNDDLLAGRRSQAGCGWPCSTLTRQVDNRIRPPANPVRLPESAPGHRACAAREWFVG
jgi:hypothetical protein